MATFNPNILAQGALPEAIHPQSGDFSIFSSSRFSNLGLFSVYLMVDIKRVFGNAYLKANKTLFNKHVETSLFLNAYFI